MGSAMMSLADSDRAPSTNRSRFGWLNPFWRSDRRLVTRLSVRECYDRLVAHAQTQNWGSKFIPPDPDRPVRGQLTTEGFSIVKHLSSVRAFQVWAFGSFMPTASGLQVNVRFALHPFVQLFQLLALGFMGLLLIIVFIDGIVSGDMSRVSGAWPLLTVFGFVLVVFWFGHHVADGEESFLLAFLMNTFDARDESALP